MKTERRTWQFWVWGFVFVFLAHALAVLRFGEKQLPTVVQEQPRPFFHVTLDPASEHRIAELTLGRDPMLFAVPGPHGFSGGAWARFQPDLPKLTNGSAPPEWLALPADQLGDTLDEYLTTNGPSEKQLLASLRSTKSIEFRIPDEPLLVRTVVKIEGPLATRKLVRTPPLPESGRAELLRRTEVAVSVNGDGIVETASIMRESGSKEADAEAVRLVREFEFDPLPIRAAAARAAAAPTIGRILFIWPVVAAPNAGPTTASAR